MKKLLFILSLFLSAASFAQTQGEISTILAASETDLQITGQGSQLALNQNIILATAGTGSTSLLGTITYKSGSFTIVPAAGTVTAGAITFEGSNDNFASTAVPLFLKDVSVPNSAPVSTYTLVAATPRTFMGSIHGYSQIRIRISTAITGTTTGVQCFSLLSRQAYSDNVHTVSSAVAANFLTTTTLSAGAATIGALTANQSVNVSQINAVTPLMGNGVTGTGSLRVTLASDNTSNTNPFLVAKNIPESVTDVASAAITTTTTTSAFTPTRGLSYQIVVPVTVVSGTTPTYDLSVEESDNAGTNWFTVYQFPRITATGIYRSPRLSLTGNRVRYVQTLTGTTPSFTRAINRLQSSDVVPVYRQIVDRSITLTTLNSTTPALIVGGAINFTATLKLGAATTPPVLQMEGSDDGGLTYYSIGNTLTGVASSSVSYTVSGVSPTLVRVRVSTAGVTVTADNLLLRAF